MPQPLTPSSSQEIIPISPPRPLKRKRDEHSTTLPAPSPLVLPPDLSERVSQRLQDQHRVERSQSGASRVKKGDAARQRAETSGMSRSRVTERMMGSLGKSVNPITNSDLYSRTDHFVSAATGHQQSNRGGGSAGQGTYWEVRGAKMAEQAREKVSGRVWSGNGEAEAFVYEGARWVGRRRIKERAPGVGAWTTSAACKKSCDGLMTAGGSMRGHCLS